MSPHRTAFSSEAAQALVALSHEACGVISGGVITSANPAAQTLGLGAGTALVEVIPEDAYALFVVALLEEKTEIRTKCIGIRASVIEWRLTICNGEVLFNARDVTALLASEDQIERNLTKLRAAAEEMEQFAYAASHDIQEPLRTITNYAAFLQQDYSSALTAEGLEWVSSIMSSAKRCRELVCSLLKYSRLGNDCSFGWVDTDAEVRGAVEAQEFSIQDAKATVHCDPLPKTWGDAALLGAVFSNLISNAVKFGGENLQIRIGCSTEKDHWLFWVQDTGRGIEDRYFTQIFDMFSRLDPSTPGVGVGLALTKKIVTLHGGKIWLTSKVDEGSTFFFTVARRHDDENPAGGGSQTGRNGGASRPEDPGNKARPGGVGRRRVRASVLASRGLLLGKGYARHHPPRPQSA